MQAVHKNKNPGPGSYNTASSTQNTRPHPPTFGKHPDNMTHAKGREMPDKYDNGVPGPDTYDPVAKEYIPKFKIMPDPD